MNEAAKAWKEETNALDDLIAEYNKLKRIGEDYTNVVNDIVDKTPDLIKSYDDLAKKIGLAAKEQERLNVASGLISAGAALGDVEMIAEGQAEADTVIGEAAAKENQEAIESAMSNVLLALTTEGDSKLKKEGVTRHVGGYGNINFMEAFTSEDGKYKNLSEEDKSVEILSKAFGQTYAGPGLTNLAGYDISLDTSSVDNFMSDYEALQKAAKEMETTLGEYLDNSDTYREVKEMLDASEAEYEKLQELKAEASEYGVYTAKANLEASGRDISNITSLKEYEEYKTALLNDENIQGDPEAEKVAE
jgi:hypothetical protein